MEKIELRKAVVEDAPRLLEIYAPYVADTAISFEYDVPSLEDFKNRIETISKKFPYIVAEIDGRVVGYCYASTFHARKAYDCSVELSIYVDSSYHGKGVGRALYAQLEKELKKINVSALYACIAATPRSDDKYLTDASIKFHGKLGFVTVGHFTSCAIKFDLPYDMVYMEKHI